MQAKSDALLVDAFVILVNLPKHFEDIFEIDLNYFSLLAFPYAGFEALILFESLA